MTIPTLRITSLCLAFAACSCSTLNIFKGPDDFSRNYEAALIQRAIDDSIEREAAGQSPNGYLTEPYSRSNWETYWNRRIHHLYDVGGTSDNPAYRGPTGPEWISYILTRRRERGLPPLTIAPENRDKVPR